MMENEKGKPKTICPEIRRASNRKILRRQMELLTECSFNGTLFDRPEASQAISSLHRELAKAECILLVRILVAFLGLLYLVKCFTAKGIKFKSEGR